jgi:hypothetical protein
MKSRTIPVSCLSLLVAAVVLAQPAQQKFEDLFAWKADIVYEGGGLVRLRIPREVLEKCKADLSDLRILTADGREIPWLAYSGPPRNRQLEQRETVPAETLHVERRQLRTGPVPRPTTQILELSPPPDWDQPWDLVIEFAESPQENVRQAQVDGVTASGAREQLATGSVFRLRGRGGASNRLHLVSGSNAYERVRLTLKGEDGDFLNPVVRYERQRVLGRHRELQTPLEIRETWHKAGVTVMIVDRPAGIVPATLRIFTSTKLYDRAAAVWDVGQGFADRHLGTGRLLRVPQPAGSRTPPSRESDFSEVSLSPARGEQLRVEIQDGDSPPLENVRIEATVSRPSVVFYMPEVGRAVLRFGGGRTRRPNYDLSTLRPPVHGERSSPEVEAVRAVYDESALGVAELGEVVFNPGFQRRGALLWAMRPGAELSTARHKYRQPVALNSSTEGLAMLALPLETIAAARPDLGDIRIVDGDGLQWPYLLQPDARRLIEDVPFTREEETPGESRYVLELPAAPLPVQSVVIDSGTPFFDRPYTLLGTLPDGREVRLSSGRMVRRIREFVPVSLSFGTRHLEGITLVVQDDDNAPLDLSSAKIHVEQPLLYLPAPEGSYGLLVGEPELAAPRYEIERVRSTILSVTAIQGRVGPLEKNADYSLAARATGGGRPARLLLWGAIILAVLILGGMTLRMARAEA